MMNECIVDLLLYKESHIPYSEAAESINYCKQEEEVQSDSAAKANDEDRPSRQE